MSHPYNLTLDIPFETSNQAKIARTSLEQDPILKADELTIDFSTQENVLQVKFSGVNDRVLRVASSNLMNNLKTIIECMDEFDGKKDQIFDIQDYKNNG